MSGQLIVKKVGKSKNSLTRTLEKRDNSLLWNWIQPWLGLKINSISQRMQLTWRMVNYKFESTTFSLQLLVSPPQMLRTQSTKWWRFLQARASHGLLQLLLTFSSTILKCKFIWRTQIKAWKFETRKSINNFLESCFRLHLGRSNVCTMCKAWAA